MPRYELGCGNISPQKVQTDLRGDNFFSKSPIFWKKKKKSPPPVIFFSPSFWSGIWVSHPLFWGLGQPASYLQEFIIKQRATTSMVWSLRCQSRNENEIKPMDRKINDQRRTKPPGGRNGRNDKSPCCIWYRENNRWWTLSKKAFNY